jgi:hypothetical protein
MPRQIVIDFKNRKGNDPIYLTEAMWEKIVLETMMNSILGDMRYDVLLEKTKNVDGKQITVLSSQGLEFLRTKLLLRTSVKDLYELDMRKAYEEWGKMPVTKAIFTLSDEGEAEFMQLTNILESKLKSKREHRAVKKREGSAMALDEAIVCKRAKSDSRQSDDSAEQQEAMQTEQNSHSSLSMPTVHQVENNAPQSSLAVDPPLPNGLSNAAEDNPSQPNNGVASVNLPTNAAVKEMVKDTNMPISKQELASVRSGTIIQDRIQSTTTKICNASRDGAATFRPQVDRTSTQVTTKCGAILRGNTVDMPIILDEESEDEPLANRRSQPLASLTPVPSCSTASPAPADLKARLSSSKDDNVNKKVVLSNAELDDIYGHGRSSLQTCVQDILTALKGIEKRQTTMNVWIKDTARKMMTIDYKKILALRRGDNRHTRLQRIGEAYDDVMLNDSHRLNVILLLYLYSAFRARFMEYGELREAAIKLPRSVRASAMLNNVSRLVLYGGHPCVLIAFALMLTQLGEKPQHALSRPQCYIPTVAVWMASGTLPDPKSKISEEDKAELARLHKSVFLKVLMVCKRKWETYADDILCKFTQVEYAILALAKHPSTYKNFIRKQQITNPDDAVRFEKGDVEIKGNTTYGENASSRTFSPTKGNRAIDMANALLERAQ